MFELALILIRVDFLLDFLMSCRETPSVVSVSVDFGLLSSEDWETEHGKFLNC